MTGALSKGNVLNRREDDPSLSPNYTGVGQASPWGISGPIPSHSPHLGILAVNELRGDPSAL
jgi:hypothetical protein